MAFIAAGNILLEYCIGGAAVARSWTSYFATLLNHHPDDFRVLEDIAKFPFTVKSDLRDNYPFGLLAVPRENLARIHGSSGTTGKPIVVG